MLLEPNKTVYCSLRTVVLISKFCPVSQKWPKCCYGCKLLLRLQLGRPVCQGLLAACLAAQLVGKAGSGRF